MKCGIKQDNCECAIDSDRCDGRHLCECGGSWKGDAHITENVLILPMKDETWEFSVGTTEHLLKLPPDLSYLTYMAIRERRNR